MGFDEIIKKIENSNKIGICGHINPDGDSIGSCLALANALDRLGKTPYVYLEECAIKFESGIGKKFIKNEETDIDLFISVDTASYERISHHKDLFNKVDNIVIDHHISNEGYGNLNFIEDDASSTCELLYSIIKKLTKINKEIAAWLYTGMITDTGNFSHGNTTPKTLRIAAELIEIGIEAKNISFFWLKALPLKKFKILSNLLETATYIENLKLVYIITDNDYIIKNNIEKSDLDAVSTYISEIEEAEILISLSEMEKGKTKASFRSRKVDVNKIASNFGGGGHKLASGCLLETSPHEAIEKIKTHLNEIEIWKNF